MRICFDGLQLDNIMMAEAVCGLSPAQACLAMETTGKNTIAKPLSFFHYNTVLVLVSIF